MHFRVAGFDQSAPNRFLSVYKPVLLVLRCQNFHDLKPLRYSYDRVTSLIFNFLAIDVQVININELKRQVFVYFKPTIK